MKAPLSLLALLWLCGPLTAQDVTGRWALRIRGPATVDRGDLRISAQGGKLLLESSDTSWQDLENFRHDGSNISFSVRGGRNFKGSLSSSEMTGSVTQPGAPDFSWNALRIQKGIRIWPVHPRVTVRQILVGSGATSSTFFSAWRSALPSLALLEREHRKLAEVAGLPFADSATLSLRSADLPLGFDQTNRHLVLELVQQIATTPASDAEFRGLFLSSAGDWRLNIHDFAWQAAVEQVGTARLSLRPMAQVLGLLGMAVIVNDSMDLRRAVWRFWQRSKEDRSGIKRLLTADDPAISGSAAGLNALLRGYDDAGKWWLEAVDWLMTHRWVLQDGLWQSPAQLVAAFWGTDSLPLPPLEIRHFGRAQAVPVVGAERLGSILLIPANAVAQEFLESQGGASESLEAWRRLEFVETTPLFISLGPEEAVLGSAASIARSRLGGFFAAHDAIRIESTITPLLAVSTVVHEWQHLLLEGARLEGDDPLGVQAEPWGIRFVEGDPWLVEGAAEWMTQQILDQFEGSMPLFGVIEAEKRLVIGRRSPEDPHLLGYLLVKVVADSLGDPVAVRKLLVQSVDDPQAVARAAGLDHGLLIPLNRPATMAMVPEVTFTMDGGVADGATRRLRIPNPLLEN